MIYLLNRTLIILGDTDTKLHGTYSYVKQKNKRNTPCNNKLSYLINFSKQSDHVTKQ